MIYFMNSALKKYAVKAITFAKVANFNNTVNDTNFTNVVNSTNIITNIVKASNKFGIKYFLYFFVLICVTCLSGCALFQTSKVSQPKVVSWQTHKGMISNLKKWSIQGKIAFNDGNSAINASITWDNNNDKYKIRIYGPFGSNSVIINKESSNLYTLKSSDGEVLRAHSAESLMNEKLGWYVPVHGLTRWIKGIPGNYSQYKFELNDRNQIVLLHQDQWKIDYDNYKEVEHLFLPTRLKFENKNVKIKFVIKKWKIK